tara:strand:+ start:156 stop:305 length:150 start_codon:yes stop_codon:yes gene_type:complete
MDKHYGPNRIKRMSKEDINKISILFGVTREEREDSHQILETTIKNNVRS